MTIEERLKNHINSKYESVNDFCIRSGIPNSTLQTVFTRGITNTSSKTIFRVCDALGLDPQSLYAGEIRSTKRSPRSDDAPEDVIEYIARMENKTLTYKGEELTSYQKRMIVFGSRIAVKMSIKE